MICKQTRGCKKLDNYDYLFKCVAVGDGGCGKTAIVVRFSQGFFQENYKLTIGVEFAVKTIHIKNHNVKLQIWDTGGQERFQYVRPLYYKGSMGCIILFDLTNRESFEHIPKWMEEVKKESGSIPMLLVGNKKDLIDERVISREEAEEIAKDLNMIYVESSAKSGDGVGDVFGVLALLMIGEEIPPEMMGKPQIASEPLVSNLSPVVPISKPSPQPTHVYTPKIIAVNDTIPAIPRKPKPSPIYSAKQEQRPSTPSNFPQPSKSIQENPFKMPKNKPSQFNSLSPSEDDFKSNSSMNIPSVPKRNILKTDNVDLNSSFVEGPEWFSPKEPESKPIVPKQIPPIQPKPIISPRPRPSPDLNLTPINVNPRIPNHQENINPKVVVPPKPLNPSLSSNEPWKSSKSEISNTNSNPFLAQPSKPSKPKLVPFTSPDLRKGVAQKSSSPSETNFLSSLKQQPSAQPEPKIIKPTRNYSFFDSPSKPKEQPKQTTPKPKNYSFLDSPSKPKEQPKQTTPKPKNYSFLDSLPAKKSKSEIKSADSPKKSYSFFDPPSKSAPVKSGPQKGEKKSSWGFMSNVDVNKKSEIPKPSSNKKPSPFQKNEVKKDEFIPSFLKHSSNERSPSSNNPSPAKAPSFGLIECPKCGAKLNKNFKFCNKCGFRTR